MIYHIASAQDWNSKLQESSFVPSDFSKEGFIHCCTEEQLAGVRERYFKGKIGLVLLLLDESKLKAELKFEKSTNDEMFPHVYGPINRDAVVKLEYI